MRRHFLTLSLLIFNICFSQTEVINGISFDAPEKNFIYQGDLFWIDGIESIKIVYGEGELMKDSFKSHCEDMSTKDLEFLKYDTTNFSGKEIEVCFRKIVTNNPNLLLMETRVYKKGFTYFIKTTAELSSNGVNRASYLMGYVIGNIFM